MLSEAKKPEFFDFLFWGFSNLWLISICAKALKWCLDWKKMQKSLFFRSWWYWVTLEAGSLSIGTSHTAAAELGLVVVKSPSRLESKELHVSWIYNLCVCDNLIASQLEKQTISLLLFSQAAAESCEEDTLQIERFSHILRGVLDSKLPLI